MILIYKRFFFRSLLHSFHRFLEQNELISLLKCFDIMVISLQMITVYLKQTTSVESQRVAQLVGNVDDSEFHRRARELYKIFYSEYDSCDTGDLESESLRYNICPRRLEVTVLSVSNLPKTDVVGSVDPFCQVSYAGSVHQTKVKRQDYNPRWEDEPFLFDLFKDQFLAENKPAPHIEVAVLDWDRFKSNDVIGSVSIPNDALNEVLNASDNCIKELELALSNNGNPVCNTVGSPSIIKIRLKNVGMVISGCDVLALKKFFLLYDKNGDGMIDKEEFSAMLKSVLAATTLFTGAESGDFILQRLSLAQGKALIHHKWMIPGEELGNPLESIMRNVATERNLSKNQLKSLDQKKKSLDTSEDRVQEAELEITNIDIMPESTTSEDSIEIIEENQKKLEALAKMLRRYGVITLPTLVWGAGNDNMPDSDSLESIATRYVFCYKLQM